MKKKRVWEKCSSKLCHLHIGGQELELPSGVITHFNFSCFLLMPILVSPFSTLANIQTSLQMPNVTPGCCFGFFLNVHAEMFIALCPKVVKGNTLPFSFLFFTGGPGVIFSCFTWHATVNIYSPSSHPPSLLPTPTGQRADRIFFSQMICDLPACPVSLLKIHLLQSLSLGGP